MALAAALAAGAAAMGMASTPRPRSPDSDRAKEVLRAIRRMDVALLRQLARAVEPDSKGAIGQNRDGYAAAAAQRGALDWMLLGAATGDQSAAEAAQRAIEYGLRRQDATGGFVIDASRFGMAWVPEPAYAGHARRFLSAAGMSAYLLRLRFPNLARGWLEEQRPKLKLAMQRLAAREDALREVEPRSSLRLMQDAVAFASHGLLLDDPSLRQLGARFLDAAIAGQLDGGAFPEPSGLDPIDQAATLTLLAQAWCLTPSGETAEYLELIMRRGIEWEQAQDLPSPEGSGRAEAWAALAADGRPGRADPSGYDEIAKALIWWAAIAQDPEARGQAREVLALISPRPGAGAR